MRGLNIYTYLTFWIYFKASISLYILSASGISGYLSSYYLYLCSLAEIIGVNGFDVKSSGSDPNGEACVGDYTLCLEAARPLAGLGLFPSSGIQFRGDLLF